MYDKNFFPPLLSLFLMQCAEFVHYQIKIKWLHAFLIKYGNYTFSEVYIKKLKKIICIILVMVQFFQII